MSPSRLVLLVPVLAGLAACSVAGPQPGTPEFAAARVSRAYECGLKVDRSRIMARLPRDERKRFVSAGADFAVKSYKAPHACDSVDRARLQHEIAELSGR